ncbi:MAG: hypothetical protein GX877_06275 [Bacteroidales bacterium]|nr:hypothetical protein [Bacteroidales bacterium]
MKKRLVILMLVLPFLVLSCVQDALQKESTSRTIQVTAILSEEKDNTNTPNNTPNTRIALKQDGLTIEMEWEEDDMVDIYLVYTNAEGETIEKFQERPVTIDNENRKRAIFSIEVPDDIPEKFDLYGLYGGSGLCTADGTKALLPTADKALTNDLRDIQNEKVVMLGFQKVNIDKGVTAIGVNFEHLGSVFRILVKNTGQGTMENITQAVLQPEDTNKEIPAYPNAERFNLKDKKFTDAGNTPTGKANHLEFTAKNAFVVENGILGFWAWFPMDKGSDSGEEWPALNLVLKSEANEFVATTVPTLTRQATTGKAYHLFAQYDGTSLTFVGKVAFDIPDGSVDGSMKGVLADTRDGNLYATIKIGDQIWLAENLRYLPEVFSPETGDGTNRYYYVYGFDGTDVNAAKINEVKINEVREICLYQTYGVLYNWPAAMHGDTSSTATPSKVQGICPDGWHLPSHQEWYDLFKIYGKSMEVAGNDFKAKGNIVDGTGLWESLNDDATNSSGFSVIPAGTRTATGGGTSGKFYSMGECCYFYASTEKTNDTNHAYRQRLRHEDGEVHRTTCAKSSGHSVRCVKNY